MSLAKRLRNWFSSKTTGIPAMTRHAPRLTGVKPHMENLEDRLAPAAGISLDLTPTYSAQSTAQTFSVLVKDTGTTAVRYLSIDLPDGFTAVSVANTSVSSGTWGTPIVGAGNVITWQTTSDAAGNGLATGGYARLDINATTSATAATGNNDDVHVVVDAYSNTAHTLDHKSDTASIWISNTSPPRHDDHDDDDDHDDHDDHDDDSTGNQYSARFRNASDTADITPSVLPGAAAHYNLRITNTGPGGHKLKFAEMAVPLGFTNVTLDSATITASNGRTWNASVVGNFIQVVQSGSPAALGTNEYLTIGFTATAPLSSGSTTWNTAAWHHTYPHPNPNQTFAVSGGQPTVTVNGPNLAIAATDATKSEGGAGTTAFSFTVTRSGDTSGTTTVHYAVTGSGGNQANAADFGGALPSGMVSFNPTETSKVITIYVSGDKVVEADEGFTVTLSNASGGDIATASATGTIENDDGLALVSIARIADSAEPGTHGKFRVTQSLVSSTDTVIEYSVDGSATADSDYTALSGSVTIPAGETMADIDVAVLDDVHIEASETVAITLTGINSGHAGVSIDNANKIATVTISDDEAAAIASLANARNFFVDSQGLFEFTFGDEKWLRGNVNEFGNTWYFIRASGDLYAWDGTLGLNGTLLLGLNGTLLMQLGANAWENPELIVDASSLTAANPAKVQAADQSRAFYRSSAGNFNLDYYGAQEKWIKGLPSAKSPANQNNPWYFIKTDGSVWEWSGADALTGTQVASITPDVNLYKDPSLLFNAFQDNTVNSAGFDLQRHFYFDRSKNLVRNLYENALGVNEKWFRGDTNQFGNPWYFVLPNGDLFAWNTGGGTGPIAYREGGWLSPANRLANLGANAWNNLERVVMDVGPDLTTSEQETLASLDQAHGLFQDSGDYNYYVNHFGAGEKWLVGAVNSSGNHWYFLLPDNSLHEWNGSKLAAGKELAANLPAAVYADPQLLSNAFAHGGVLDSPDKFDPFNANPDEPGDTLV